MDSFSHTPSAVKQNFYKDETSGSPNGDAKHRDRELTKQQAKILDTWTISKEKIVEGVCEPESEAARMSAMWVDEYKKDTARLKELEAARKALKFTSDDPPSPFEIYTAASIENTVFPDPKSIVPNLLLVGLNFLAGAPKIGKSWLALAIALAIAQGGKVFSSIDVIEGEVLYLALEDNKRRMQKRIRMLNEPDAFPPRLHIVHQSPKLSAGLEEFIGAWLKEHPTARCVIIDTLARIRKQRGKNADSYAEDSEAAARLQKLAFDFDVCVLVIHHIRKAEANDPMEMVSGTFGLTGGADGVLVIKRSRGQTDATLTVMGRDIEEQELALNYCGGAWDLIGDAAEYAISKTRQEVIQLLRQAKEPMRPRMMAAELNRAENTLLVLLRAMVEDGQISKTDRGHYTVSSTK